MAKKEEEAEEEKKEANMFPVRIPNTLIEVMDRFLDAHPELGIASRQELARRAIADWIIEKRKELMTLR
ncbi:ribbon-helix-helix domain-containing protein [bacterium]|nr:ribbon-helix-helix domain-containing protein [bacterium]